MSRFTELFPSPLPLIGAVRLPPLPDRPGSPGLDAIIAHAVSDAVALADAGMDGVLLVNEHDRPHRIRAQPDTISAMTRAVRAVAEQRTGLVVGCQILLNDPIASLAVARTSGASFIRCDHFVDPMKRREFGEMVIDPDGLLAYRHEIDADDILVLADIQVRDATLISERSLRESAAQASLHQADAVIVTGDAAGEPPPARALGEALAGIADGPYDSPLLLGGGLRPDNAASLLPLCDGAIVATSVTGDSSPWPRMEPSQLRALRNAVDTLRR